MGAVMMKTIVLICLLSQSPHECTKDTAVTVLYGPNTSSLSECGRNGFTLWSTSRQFDPKTEWPKVGCISVADAATN